VEWTFGATVSCCSLRAVMLASAKVCLGSPL
jgi:hypothetical protein